MHLLVLSDQSSIDSFEQHMSEYLRACYLSIPSLEYVQVSAFHTHFTLEVCSDPRIVVGRTIPS